MKGRTKVTGASFVALPGSKLVSVQKISAPLNVQRAWFVSTEENCRVTAKPRENLIYWTQVKNGEEVGTILSNEETETRFHSNGWGKTNWACGRGCTE